MRLPSLLLAAVLVAAPLAAAAQDGNFGRVTRYNREQVRLFNADGTSAGRADRDDLPANATIVDIRPGGGLGIQHGGRVVYVRGIDVEFQLNEAGSARCASAGGGQRADGDLSTGTYAGGGSSQDCRIGGGR